MFQRMVSNSKLWHYYSKVWGQYAIIKEIHIFSTKEHKKNIKSGSKDIHNVIKKLYISN